MTASVQNSPPRVCLIATGGTIAMKQDAQTGAPVPAVTGEDLVAGIPGLAGMAHVEVVNLSNIPSPNMNPERWLQLRQEVQKALALPDTAGLVITHGTDTLEEAAWFMELTLQSSKPVVFTGAQRNHSDADFDGPQNLLDAIRTATSPQAQNQGVMLVMNREIHAARTVTKTHTSQLDTFKSPHTGPLGCITAEGITWHQNAPRSPHFTPGAEPFPTVEIIPCFGGSSPTLLHASIQAGAKGVVIQALGMGNVNIEMHEAIAAILEQGIPVVISTRVPAGGVSPHYGYQGGGQQLAALGAIMAADLNPQKARILLMLALHTHQPPAKLQTLFQ
jgi:L-asparaginase